MVFPELALTTFFPRWVIDDPEELESYFETEMPNNETQPLFAAARELGVGFHLGYAEMVIEDDGSKRYFNTAVIVDRAGQIAGKYRKVHIPGHAEPQPGQVHQHLEKRYFEPGDLGFPVFRTMDGVMGMCICNDRRWPETYRVMGLQGRRAGRARLQHAEHQSLRQGAGGDRTSACSTTISPCRPVPIRTAPGWSLAAKAGMEEGIHHMGGSCIIAPTGEIVAQAQTEGDEVIAAPIDLERGVYIRETIFDFAAHRRIEHYGLISSQTGAEPPPA